MILYQNSLLKLHYYPENSLIEVNWPNLEPYSLPDAKLAMTRLVVSIRSYEVKNLLVDSSQTSVNNLNAEQFNGLISEVMKELQKTKLQRIARVKSADQEREERAGAVTLANGFPFEFMNFQSREDALIWIRNTKTKLPG